jgi:hypothetical protein
MEWNIVNELEHSTSGVVSSLAPNLKIMNNLKKTTDNVFYFYLSKFVQNTHTHYMASVQFSNKFTVYLNAVITFLFHVGWHVVECCV